MESSVYLSVPIGVAVFGLLLFCMPTKQPKLTRVGEILFFLGVWVTISVFTRAHVLSPK